MAEHQYIEHIDRRSGLGTGMIVGTLLVLLVGVVVLFLFLGGPGRLVGETGPAAPNTTNVNVAPQAQPQSAPQINVPREIDININQPPAQVQVIP